MTDFTRVDKSHDANHNKLLNYCHMVCVLQLMTATFFFAINFAQLHHSFQGRRNIINFYLVGALARLANDDFGLTQLNSRTIV